jgi:hypothetical protein
MSERKFSHYVVSLSGEKGKGPWLALGSVSHHITPDLQEAEGFDTRKEARDLLGWARVEYGPEAKVMGVRAKAKEVTTLDVARATVVALEEAERLGVKLVIPLGSSSLSASWQVNGSNTARGRLVYAKEPVTPRRQLDFIREISAWIREELGVKP